MPLAGDASPWAAAGGWKRLSMRCLMKGITRMDRSDGRWRGSLASIATTRARSGSEYTSGSGGSFSCTILYTSPSKLDPFHACCSAHSSYRMQPSAHTSLL